MPRDKFLYFSSIIHLNNSKGAMILGGSDEDENYYR
jgi:hypothetical protein